MRNFTTEDFRGAGQYLVRMGPEELAARQAGKTYSIGNTGYLSTVMFKVGYHTNNAEIGNGEQLTCLIAMSDGHTSFYHYPNIRKATACRASGQAVDFVEWEKVFWQKQGEVLGIQIFVDHLNTGEEEYRFATQEEVVRVVMYQSSRWR
jgi:hypothetical protein